MLPHRSAADVPGYTRALDGFAFECRLLFLPQGLIWELTLVF
jgi:hypothetical protein